MPSSTLTPDNYPAGRDRSIHQGHGIAALGPSDSSDSGSDIQGGPGLARAVDGFGLDQLVGGADAQEGEGETAGPDVGDGNLDSDSDRNGTGETASAARDSVGVDGADIDTDRIVLVEDWEAEDAEAASLNRPSRRGGPAR